METRRRYTWIRDPRDWGIGIVLSLIALGIVAIILVIGFFANRASAEQPAQQPLSLAAIVAGDEPAAATSATEELPLEAVFNGVAYPEEFGFEVKNGCGVRYGEDSFFVMTNGDQREVVEGEESYVFGCEENKFYLKTGIVDPNAETNLSGTLEEAEFAGQSYAEDSIHVTGFPEASVPVRWGNGVVQANTNPVDASAWIVAEPGVLSADDIADCAGNLSCVWSGGASVDNVMENETGTYLCPEGGYIKATFPQGTMSAGGFSISVDEAAGTAYTFLARCPYAEGEGDNSLPIDFTSEHKGRMKVMRYPVPFQAGGFFSYDHLVEDMNNALGVSANHDEDGADNCGNEGCARNVLILVDYNHGSLGVYSYTGPNQWAQIYQNVQRPTPAQ